MTLQFAMFQEKSDWVPPTELPDLSPQVIGTPTFIVRESGKEIGRIRGYTDADMFYWQLSAYISIPAN